MHGAQKFGIIGDGNIAGFAGVSGIPFWLGFIVGSIELAGGLAILLGLFTRIVALVTGIEMMIIYVIAHVPNGINPLTNGGELALLFLAAFLVVHTYGAKKLSLERAIFKKEIF